MTRSGREASPITSRVAVVRLRVCGGWHTHLDILVDVLEGREPKAFWKTHTALEAEYGKRLKA